MEKDRAIISIPFSSFNKLFPSYTVIIGTDRIISELGSPIFTPFWSCYFNYRVTIKVIGTNYPIKIEWALIVFITTIIFTSIALGYIVLQHKRKTNRFKVEETEDYIIIQ